MVSRESSSGLRTSMVWTVRECGLTDSSNVCGSGVSLFFRGVSAINFLISSGIIAFLRDLW